MLTKFSVLWYLCTSSMTTAAHSLQLNLDLLHQREQVKPLSPQCSLCLFPLASEQSRLQTSRGGHGLFVDTQEADAAKAAFTIVRAVFSFLFESDGEESRRRAERTSKGGEKASEGNREKAIEKGRSLELFDKRHLHKASPGSRAAVVNKKTASTSPSCRSAGFTLIKDWKGAHLRAPKSLTPPITTRFP